MEIRSLGVGDLDACFDNRNRAFGPMPEASWQTWYRYMRESARAGYCLGEFEGSRLVASSRTIEFTQWWHGRAVAIGGVCAVSVAPEDRGRGSGRRIVSATLDLCAERGFALAMLFPATTPLYRSLGWEHAGGQYRVSLPSEALRTLAAEVVPVRRARPGDEAEVTALLRAVHAAARDSGPVDWGERTWRVHLETDGNYCYLADDGFLSYRWDRGSLHVDKVVAASEATARGLWAIVGSGSSIAETVRAHVSPRDPVFWLVRERSVEASHREPWMLRLVDAPAAIEARGFPAAVSAEVPLRIDDPRRPSNSGLWRLVVRDGGGRLESMSRAGDEGAAVSLGARGLAALYSGVPASTLLRSGLLSGGGPVDHDALTAAFAADPFCLDFF